ncbi:MAG: sugar phosphate nucleotidyltransferase [Candidatus Peregrinibacteria bacterium]|nr:sugar phosphate nucleotidyltransferase [Candidatus Peregrinibacteria bacterium]
MKGIILAGGSGTRLRPLTKITSKQLLPVYDKPMIYYPLETLIRAGIKDVLVIVSPEHAGDFLNLLGSGSEFGIKIAYEIQDKPEGLAQAFIIGDTFIGNDDVTLVLGDNIFEDDFSDAIKNFQKGGMIFAREVSDPHRFGVVEFDENKKAISLEEKPEVPKSNFAQTGLYVCDNSIVEMAKNLAPSPRGELEVTDLMKMYLDQGKLEVGFVQGKWFDCGTHESLFEAGEYMRGKK